MPPDPLSHARAQRLRVGAGAAVVLLLAGIAVSVLVSTVASSGHSEVVIAPAHESVPTTSIYVHVLGEVAEPGIYELSEGARVVDAIAAAGGYTDAAERSQNLARFVSDGEQLLVSAEGEEPPSATSHGLIDINSADATLLETLPRIGPALADRIVRWRVEYGRFRTVDDLVSVPGIGPATLAEFRELVTVR